MTSTILNNAQQSKKFLLNCPLKNLPHWNFFVANDSFVWFLCLLWAGHEGNTRVNKTHTVALVFSDIRGKCSLDLFHRVLIKLYNLSKCQTLSTQEGLTRTRWPQGCLGFWFYNLKPADLPWFLALQAPRRVLRFLLFSHCQCLNCDCFQLYTEISCIVALC